MKITINGNITPETINSYLEKQKDKTEKIKEFCKTNKIEDLAYKDSELEFEYHFTDVSKKKEFTTPKPKVETRGGVKDGKD